MNVSRIVSLHVQSDVSPDAKNISAKKRNRKLKTRSSGLYLVRSGGTYLFQIRLPKRIGGGVGSRPIRVSLGALPHHQARELADALGALAPALFRKIEKRMVAYYTAREEIGAEALRPHLADTLPDYMVPAAYVRLGAMPLTPNGKLNRDALPAPDGAAYSRGYVTPEGEVEETIAAIWADILRIEQVGRYDNFFELGRHSLMAVRAINRSASVFAIDVSLRSLFARPVLADQAAFIEARLATSATPSQDHREIENDRIDAIAVSLPGREARISAPLPTSLETLADRLAGGLAPRTRRHYAMFGYSMSTLLAYEIVRRWTRAGLPGPEVFFILADLRPLTPSKFW